MCSPTAPALDDCIRGSRGDDAIAEDSAPAGPKIGPRRCHAGRLHRSETRNWPAVPRDLDRLAAFHPGNDALEVLLELAD
jgi:hypothetical protein